MAGLTKLIEDVEGTIAQRSAPARERTLSKITDLLVRDAERLGSEQVALFDHVLGCVAPQVQVPARADLAARLAELANAPPNVTRTLAFDEDVVVAQPILSRSGQLSDQDLIEVAVTRGAAHMTAICERRHVSELVTDVLVAKGDMLVWRAIASNAGARFSELGKAELLDRSSADEALQDLLGARDDLSEGDMRRLVDMARQSAKTHIATRMAPPETAPRAEQSAPVGFDYAMAQGTLREIGKKGPLSESDLAGLAQQNDAAAALTAVALLAALPLPAVERMFRDRDDVSLLLIGKAQHWSWRTVRALLGLRHPLLPEPKQRAAEATFDAISVGEARRALQAMTGSASKSGGTARSRIRRDGR